MPFKITVTVSDDFAVGVAVEPAVPIALAMGAIETAKLVLAAPLLREQSASKIATVPAGALRALPKAPGMN